jgi:hypothetical protein
MNEHVFLKDAQTCVVRHRLGKNTIAFIVIDQQEIVVPSALGNGELSDLVSVDPSGSLWRHA